MSKPTYKELEKRVRELEKAEKSTIDAEQHWKSLTQNSKDFIAIVDENGLIHYINKTTPPATPEDMIGNSVYNYMEGDYRDIFKKTLKKVFKTGQTCNYEIQVEGSNGHRWHNADIIPIKTDNKVSKVILVSEDITERKKAEEALQESEKQLNQVYNSTSDLLALIEAGDDNRYRIVSFNDAYWRTIQSMAPNVAKEEFIGIELSELYSLLNIPESMDFITKFDVVRKTRKPSSTVEKIPTLAGEVYLETIVTPVLDDNKECTRILYSSHYITELMITQEKVKESEEKYRSLVNNIPDVIWTGDFDGKSYFISRNVESMLGYTTQEIYEGGENFIYDRIHPEDVERIRTSYQNLFRKETRFDEEYRFQRKDGEWIWIRDRATKIYEKDDVKYVNGIFSDITERKEVEEALHTEKLLSEEYINSIPGLFYVFDKKRFVRWNKNWTAVTGYSDEELAAMYGMDFFKGEDRKLIGERMLKVFKEGTADAEAELVTKDGRRISYYFTGQRKVLDGNEYLIGLGINITERTKAEQALLESEEKFRIVTQTAEIGITETDLVTGKVQWDDTCYRIHGFESGTEINLDRFLTDIIHPDEKNGALSRYKEALDSDRKRFRIEYRILRPDGTVRWLDEDHTIIRNHEDKAIRTFSAKMDITERKQAEQELLESKEFNEKIISESPIGIVIYDEAGQCITANDSLGEMIGTTIKQVLAQNYTKLESWQKYGLLDTAKKALHDNETKYHFSKVLTTFGKLVFIEYYFVPFKRAGKTYIMLMATDITERMKAEEALRDSEANLKEAQNAANMGSWAWDLKTNNVTWSDNLCLIHGMKPEEFDGTFETATSLIHPDDLEKVNANIKQLQSKKLPLETEYRIITKDGLIKFVLGTQKLIFDDKGNVIKMIGTLQDITERRQLEEQLQIRQRMDSLGTLAGGIAHDFNNILVGIMGNINLLNMDNDNFTEDQRECINDAEQGSKRAAKLIRQFQTLSRASFTEKSAVDIHDIPNEVFSLLKETTDRLIAKEIEFEKGEFYVNANPTELHQVLLNLATNSVQAIEERGARKGDYIRIEAEDYEVASGDRTGLSEGDYIHISFKDNGIGMSDEVMKRAFDPMFSTKEEFNKKGQGLGLAMVYNIVTRKCNGHIYIDSKESKGTTIHIFLPKAQPDADTQETKITDIIGGTETILVVDDEPLVIKFTKKLLTKKGYAVITANDGKEALKIYKKQKDSIDLVILDLTMPQMSGLQLFQKLLEINPDVNVIISSGHGDEYTKEGILAEAKGNVGKPYTMKDLAQAVRTVLDS